VPASWSRKDERQYEHIVSSCTRPRKTCKRIAAATVNKRRSNEGRTLGLVVPAMTASESKRRIAELRRAGYEVSSKETSTGTIVFKKCHKGLGDFVVQAKAIPGHPRTGGWSPGWGPACTNTPLRSHKDANDYIKKIRVAGAQYRIMPGESPRCSNALNLAALAAMAAAGVAVLVMK
jgi:hypothetical protein